MIKFSGVFSFPVHINIGIYYILPSHTHILCILWIFFPVRFVHPMQVFKKYITSIKPNPPILHKKYIKAQQKKVLKIPQPY